MLHSRHLVVDQERARDRVHPRVFRPSGDWKLELFQLCVGDFDEGVLLGWGYDGTVFPLGVGQGAEQGERIVCLWKERNEDVC